MTNQNNEYPYIIDNETRVVLLSDIIGVGYVKITETRKHTVDIAMDKDSPKLYKRLGKDCVATSELVVMLYDNIYKSDNLGSFATLEQWTSLVKPQFEAQKQAKSPTNEAIVPSVQNEAKITNLQASQLELSIVPDTDTDTVKVAIEIANFVTNYFGYTRPVILVKDNVATLRYVDTLQLQFSITVAISSGNVACLSGMDIKNPHEREIVDYLLDRFTSNVVSSITLAKLKPTITNLAMPVDKLSNTCPNCNGVVGSWQSNCPHCGLSTLDKFWDNVVPIPFN